MKLTRDEKILSYGLPGQKIEGTRLTLLEVQDDGVTYPSNVKGLYRCDCGNHKSIAMYRATTTPARTKIQEAV